MELFPEIGEGERITGEGELGVTLLADIEQLGAVEFRSSPGGVTPPLHVHAKHADRPLLPLGPGERGAEPHIHHHHADGFLVVEGEFTFTFRDGPVALPAGTFLLIPPGVVHGFDNDSRAANARCFNFHAPSMGFGDYLRGQNPDFDQHDPPADGGADPASIVAVRLEQAIG